MKRFIGFLFFTVFVLAGCAMRVKSYDVDRVDQELKGNRGMLTGSAPAPVVTEAKKTTRKVYNLEVEMPSLLDFKKREARPKRKRKDTELYGNRGYMHKSSGARLKAQPTRKRPSFFGERPSKDTPPMKTYQGPAEKLQELYVVKKGDTLQKISNDFYGTTKRWKKIYEANKKVLKAPDLIKEGQKLVIPMD